MTEGNEAYQVMTSRVSDAWRAGGAGPGWTWPRKIEAFSRTAQRSWPMLRLDYCFCTKTVEPRQMYVVRELTGSDHCPIVVDTVVRAASNGTEA
jgi:endonuclease/exonuclease/phosphatase family metal-dependent hydrolase